MNDRTESNPFDTGPTSHLDADQCLALAHGLLSRSEAELLLSHLEICPECEFRFRAQVSERERLLARGKLRTRADGSAVFEPQLLPVISRRYSVRSILRTAIHRPIFQYATGAIAFAALCLFILMPKGTSPLIASGLVRLRPYIERDGVLMGADSPQRGDFIAGMRSYDRGEFDEAIHLLEEAKVSMTREPYRRAFLGNALALRNRHAEAIAVLWPLTEAVLADEWKGDIYQTLIVSLRECGEVDRADSLLGALPSWELPPKTLDRLRGILHESNSTN